MDGFKNTTKMKYMGAGGMVDGYSMGGYAKGGNAKPTMKGNAKPMMKGDAKPMMKKAMGGAMMDKPMMGMGGAMMNGYAKGGDAKVGAKIAKVMGEFKKGELHSGSKDGAKVKSPKQAMAIALSEAGKGKMPMKKGGGGDVKMPSPAESAASGNRMAEMKAREMREMMRREKGMGAITEREMRMMREMKKRVPATRREPMLPPVGDSVRSGNRMSAQEGAEMREMMRRKKGGLAVMPKGKC